MGYYGDFIGIMDKIETTIYACNRTTLQASCRLFRVEGTGFRVLVWRGGLQYIGTTTGLYMDI